MHNNTKIKLNYLTEFIQKNYKNWEKKYPNLLGAYSGKKYIKNEPSYRYAIVFLVSQKVSYPVNPVPKHFSVKIPKDGIKKIPTDIIVSEKYELFEVSLCGKIERSNASEFGTIGIFLLKDGYTYACTNAHVLLRDRIDTGDTYFFKPLAQQNQPDVNLYDQSGNAFKAYIQEGIFGGIDAAICRVDNPDNINNSIPGFGFPSGIRLISKNDVRYPLKMKGFKTEFSQGEVLRTDLTIPTPYPNIYFHNIVEVSLISQHGDSGSPVFNNALQLVGIIVGGKNNSSYVIPIEKILNYFGCDLMN